MAWIRVTTRVVYWGIWFACSLITTYLWRYSIWNRYELSLNRYLHVPVTHASCDCNIFQRISDRILPNVRIGILILLRTPISAKYCWFGGWLGAWSTPSHHPTQLCDIYISGYEYTLISEWTRLFGLLRILDNLISGAVCYFCTTISVFCEIYTLRMRVVAHTAILWVWWFLCRRPELGLSICPHHWCRNPGDLNVLGRSRASVGQVLVPLGRVYRPFGQSSPVGWLGGWVVGAGPRGWALAAVVSLLVKGRT